MSIKDKLFWGYSVLIFFALLSTVLISQNYTERAFYENTVSAHKRELTLITNSLQSEIDHIGDYEMSVALDSTVISTLEKNPFVTETDAEYNVVRRVLGNTINSIIGMNQEIFQWDIITLDNRFLYVSGYDLLTSIEDTLGPAYFTEANSGRSIVLNGPFMVEGSGETQTAMPIFVMSKQIVKLETLEALGYVAFFVTEDSIASVFEENIPQGAKADFFLISQDNTILSSSKKDVIGKDLAEVMNLSEKNEQEIFQKGTWVNGRDKNSALYTVTPMEQNGWRVVYVTPLEALMNSHYSVRKIVTLIGIVTFLLSIVMIAVIAQRITYPIVYLFQKMITYYRQEPETRIVIDSKDENKKSVSGI